MNLKIEDFDGPFDVLLHLVKESKMDIYKVNISDIIEQYLLFINSLDKEDIDSTSEYLVFSAELIHLKSKKLVNKTIIDEEEDSEFNITSEEDLRDKLIEYEKYKRVTDSFRLLEENRNNYYTKLPENINEYMDNDKVVNSEIDIDDLVNAFLEMQKRVNFLKPEVTRITKKEYSVKEKIKEIRNLLSKKDKIYFEELFDIITKDVVVVTFLSLLDMSKNKEINIKQEKVFSRIVIEKM